MKLFYCILFLLLLSACGSDLQNTEPVKFGYIGALSGISGSITTNELDGITLALDEANSRGNLPEGRKIELLRYNDESDTTKSVLFAQKLVNQDKVLFVFGTINSATSLAVMPIFTKAGIGQMTGAIIADMTAKGSRYIFRNTSAGTALETTLVNYLVQKGYKKFALISDISAYGKNEGDYQQAALRSKGLSSMIRESYQSGETNYTRQLSNILKTGPEVILLGSLAVDSGLITTQARKMGYKGKIAGGFSVGTLTFIETAGIYSEGIIFSSPYIDNNLNEMTREFARKFKTKYGYEPAAHAARGYDGASMVLFAIQNIKGKITSEAITEEIHKIKNFQGLQGLFTYQENGEGISKCLIGIIQQGKLLSLDVY